MILKLVRTPAVYLIGFMGCGKSTVGKLLAERIGWDFYDLDDDIEREARQSIPEIFRTHGESHFREREQEALSSRVRLVQAGHAMVLALGGGACISPECLQRLSNNGVTIYLDCPHDVLWERVTQFEHRPLARDPERFRALYDERRPQYQRAEYRIAGEGRSPEAIVDEILNLGIF